VPEEPAQTTPLTSARAPGHWPGPPPLEGPGALAGPPPGGRPCAGLRFLPSSCLSMQAPALLGCPARVRRALAVTASGKAAGNKGMERHMPQTARLWGKRDPPPSLLLSAENPHYGFGDLVNPMRPRKPGFGTCPAPSLGTPQGRIGSQPVRTCLAHERAYMPAHCAC
jgi:hypothetical protein